MRKQSIPRVNKPVGTHPSAALAIFARAAIPGKTKTRLIPALGREGAAEFHRALVSDTLRKVLRGKGHVARYLFIAGDSGSAPMATQDFERYAQRGSDLGERLGHAFRLLLRRHSRVVVIGTDSPLLTRSMLRLALEELRVVDAVLGPCPDGGYYLIGLRKFVRGLFSKVRLGSEFAFADTLASLLSHGFSCSLLEPCPDIDRPQDLQQLKGILAKGPSARRLMPHTWRFLSSAKKR